MSNLANEYPHLFREALWSEGSIQVRFKLLNSAPPHHLIANVNIVPRTRNGWLLIRLINGLWEIPGGTLELGESYTDTIKRELMEEADARLQSFQLFGAWHCLSLASKPYRPHLPFPEFYRIVGMGMVKLVQTPKNPADGEQVSLVECVPLATVVKRFISIERYDLAELYQLASKQAAV